MKAVIGFSAVGHLAALLGSIWHQKRTHLGRKGPPAVDYAVYCDAVYDLEVGAVRGYLPMVMR
jgi:hypothetical protein